MARPAASPTTYRVRLDDRRRPTLPPALLEEAGIAPGVHEMIARVDGPGRVILEDPIALLLSLQEEVAAGKVHLGVAEDLSESLLRDRAVDRSLA